LLVPQPLLPLELFSALPFCTGREFAMCGVSAYIFRFFHSTLSSVRVRASPGELLGLVSHAIVVHGEGQGLEVQGIRYPPRRDYILYLDFHHGITTLHALGHEESSS